MDVCCHVGSTFIWKQGPSNKGPRLDVKQTPGFLKALNQTRFLFSIHACLFCLFNNRYNGKVGYIPTMYLQPHNYPPMHMTHSNQNLLATSPNPLQQSHQLSRSQGNLLQLPPARSPSPHQLQAGSRERSRSFNALTEQPPGQPAIRAPANAAKAPTTPAASKHIPPPVITVEADGEEERRGRSPAADSEDSFLSDSSSSSFSDDLSSSSASSTFTLSQSTHSEQLHSHRSPAATTNNHLSPTSGLQGRLMPSVSDPNLYKGSSSPTVPPRPRAQEILTRCSSITRKNAAKGAVSP